MKEDDTAEVFAVEQAVAASPWSQRLFSDCVAVGYECWVIVEETEIIGFGVMSCAVGESHLLNIAVHPNRQHQGFGKKLLQHFIDLARSLGAEEMYLEVRVSNHPARELYKQFKFNEINFRKDYYPAGDHGEPKEDALVLALLL